MSESTNKNALSQLIAAEQLDAEIERIATEYWAQRQPLAQAFDRLRKASEVFGAATVDQSALDQFCAELFAFANAMRVAGISDDVANLDHKQIKHREIALELMRAAIKGEKSALAVLVADIARLQNRLPEFYHYFGVSLLDEVLGLWRLKHQPATIQKIKELATRLGIDPAEHLSPKMEHAKLSDAARGMLHGSELDMRPKRLPIIEYWLDKPKAAPIGDPATKPTPSVELTKVEQALIMLKREPNLSNRAIAERIGCDPSLLSKDQMFLAAKAALAGSVAKGSKARDGAIEAAAGD